jgi:isochorismate synthase EntC
MDLNTQYDRKNAIKDILDLITFSNVDFTIFISKDNTLYIGFNKSKKIKKNLVSPTFYCSKFNHKNKIEKYKTDITFVLNSDKLCIFKQSNKNLDFYFNTNNKPQTDKCLYSICQNNYIHPNYNKFCMQIDTLKTLFKQNFVHKFVLNRCVEIKQETKIDIKGLLKNILYEYLISNSPRNHFFFARSYKKQNNTFISFSPETLLRIKENTLYTEALAGSSEKDNTQILNLNKNKSENAIVQESILSVLQKFGYETFIGDTEIIHLPYISHLKTPIHCNISTGVKLKQIIKHLHPTPATLGHPKKNSLQLLKEMDIPKRNLFAGIAGVETENNTDIIVLLRSAYLQQKSIILYAGAGVMPESVPEIEWSEIALKMTPIIEHCFNKDCIDTTKEYIKTHE